MASYPAPIIERIVKGTFVTGCDVCRAFTGLLTQEMSTWHTK